MVGRVGGWRFPKLYRSEVEFELASGGGVDVPLMEFGVEFDFVATPDPSVLESVLGSLFLLLLERRRSSDKNLGAMAHHLEAESIMFSNRMVLFRDIEISEEGKTRNKGRSLPSHAL